MKSAYQDGSLHLLNPIPVWKRIITEEEVGCSIEVFNNNLINAAKQHYQNWEVEVPDEKHLDKSSIGKESINELSNREIFSHSEKPSIGKWHAVPTNNFLNLEIPEVRQLKDILVRDYQMALKQFANLEFDTTYNLNEINALLPKMDESWIQFYKNGDNKVLHNHLRYEASDEYKHIWAGGYYINEGKPDKWQPYSGRFEFNIRHNRYFIKPKTGMILMWPGDILHAVNPFYGSEERICINFNLHSQ